MINLKVRTEYSFRFAFGKIKSIIESEACAKTASITDRYTTFGHIPFYNLCKKREMRYILGIELALVVDADLKVRQTPFYVTLLAKNYEGLKKIYELASKATKQKYYYPRLAIDELLYIKEQDVIIIFEDSYLSSKLVYRKNTYYGISPMSNNLDYLAIKGRFFIVAISDNLYDKADNKNLYQIVMGNNMYIDRVEPSHLLSAQEWKDSIPFLTDEQKQIAIMNTHIIADKIEQYNFSKAILPLQQTKDNFKQLCIEGAKKRNCDLTDPIYEKRLNRELELIKQKQFEDYFLLVRDLVVYAKQHMLVGAARGSSAGSLVCYLLEITDIDPIPFGLIFERFIDINRKDLPDIDIDFQDTKRDMCLKYLKNKYGNECVAKLGTVSKYKPKSILTELAKVLQIPLWEITDLKDAIITRSGGDARASNCLEDTFTELKIGQEFLKKYPNLKYAQSIESHSRHYGQHAAGIVVSDKPLYHYCAIDLKNDSCMLDKKDAERVNLLKIDCLGLRTLSVIQDCLDIIDKDREWLFNYPLTDQKAFDIINDRKFYGIFQFEGYALISLSKQINIQQFEDIAAITALARPGPLISGGATKYIKAKNENKAHHLPLCEPYTKDTFGVIIYQEQVMNIVRNIGGLSWEDTSTLRKAMSKSLGEEYFNQFWEKFKVGAKQKHNMEEKVARKIWDSVNAFGSWAFNKSHSVAYGLISYWCMVLKAYHPLEFALATLQNAKSEDQVIQMLKELDNEGYKYKAFDNELSEIEWSIKDNTLIGGFINIKGVGKIKSQKLIHKRKHNQEYTTAEKKLLYNAETPYDTIFEFREKFHKFYENWFLWFKEKPCYLKDIEGIGEHVRFICKVVQTNLRDANEAINIKKRKGKVITKGCIKFLDLKFQDDTDMILGRINREKFMKYGENIINKNKIGDYYLVKGRCCTGFRYIIVEEIKKITEEQINEKLNKMTGN